MLRTNTYESPNSGSHSGSVDAKRFSFGMPQEMQFGKSINERESSNELPIPLVSLDSCPKCARKFLPTRLQSHIKCCNVQVVTKRRGSIKKAPYDPRPISPISEVVNSINNEIYFKQIEEQNLNQSPKKQRRNQHERQKRSKTEKRDHSKNTDKINEKSKDVPNRKKWVNNAAIASSRNSKDEIVFDQNLCNDLQRILNGESAPKQQTVNDQFVGSFNRNKLSIKSIKGANKSKMSVDLKSEGQKLLNNMHEVEPATPTLIEDMDELESQDIIVMNNNLAPKRMDTGSFISNDMPIGVSNLDKKISPADKKNDSIIIQA